MKRRELLIASGQLALLNALSGLSSPIAWAQTAAGPRNLIWIDFANGWDVTLGLDPQVKASSFSDSALYLGYKPGEIIQAGGLRLGPAAASMAEFADSAVIINGVSMQGNISHEDCRRMTATGIIDRQTPEIVAMKAMVDGGEARGHSLFDGSPMTTGDLDLETASFMDLETLLSADGNNEIALDPESAFAANLARSAKFRARIEKYLLAHPDLKARLDQARANYSNLSELRALETGLAFATGYSRTVHMMIQPASGSLDTHTNHARDHLPAQTSCWDQLAAFVKTLKSVPVGKSGRSAFDESLIVVTSEFSRETCLNGSSVESAGKEHNGYTNSYLLLGGSLRGGQTIGGSVIQANALGRPSLHAARNFDFRKQAVIRTAADMPDYLLQNPSLKRQILPGHVIATLADLFGCRANLDPVLAKFQTLTLNGRTS